MSVFTRDFWRATAERAVSTAAQSAILVIGADQLNVMDADWGTVAGFAAGGAVLSILKAIVASGTGASGPGFGGAEELTGSGNLDDGVGDH